MEFTAYQKQGMHFSGGTFSDTLFENIPYISRDLLDSIFGGKGQWFPAGQQFKTKDQKGRPWVFSLDNPFILFAGQVYNFTYPIRRDANQLYLPLHPLLRFLRNKFGMELTWAQPLKKTKPKTMAAAPDSIRGNIYGMEIEQRNNGTLLKIRADPNLTWNDLTSKPHFLLKLEKGRLAASFPKKISGKGLIKSVTSLQEEELVQITLQLQGSYDSVEVLVDSTLPGFLVSIYRAGEKLPDSTKTSQDSNSEVKGTIILDAGHGGNDRGAVIKGVEEANVTLAVAQELKKILSKLGYKVLLTREGDVFKTLQERPKFASDHGGDLFISLHCNSLSGSINRLKSISGFTVYILREGESEEDKALARRENEAIQQESGKSGKTEISPVDWILMEHQLNLYTKQSEKIAEIVVDEFEDSPISKYSTGARQAGFFVLVGAYMPAILFEMGFLTHDKDRRLMSTKSGQLEIANRLAKAIHQFQKRKASL